MIKISLQELQQLLELVRKTSGDVHLGIRLDTECLVAQYQRNDGTLIEARIYDEAQRSFAKVISSERLSEAHKRLKA